METVYYVWTPILKWIFGAFFLALIVWAVIVVKRAIVGKGDGILHRVHLKKGT